MLSSLHLPRSKAVTAIVLAAVLSVAVVLWAPVNEWPAGILLSLALSWASFVDLDRQILPNALTIGLVAAGIMFGVAVGEPPLPERILGATMGYVSLVAVALVYRHLRRREGLGRGDAKLFAAGGAWLGWEPLTIVMLVASSVATLYLLGCMVMKLRVAADHSIPFGPFIALGTWSVWIGQVAHWL
jgi:leader peptidase (prepilin peptidase) / N-methyltransferase